MCLYNNIFVIKLYMVYSMAFTIDRRMINALVLAAVVYFTCHNVTAMFAVAVASYILTMI